MAYIVPDGIPSLPSSDTEFDWDIGEENEEQLPDDIDGVSRQNWKFKNDPIFSCEETIIEENLNTKPEDLSYKEVLLKHQTENTNHMIEISKLSNDRKNPIEFCQKLGTFLNFSHFQHNQSVDMSQFEDFIRNEYCHFLDDEDLNILKKICSGDMGCFAIFEKCVGQFMNCQFCFTKSIENEKMELDMNFRPSYEEIVEFIAYFKTRIHDVCIYLKPKIYSVYKFSKIAHAVLWDYCQFSTFKMLNFILNNQQLWEKFVYDFEYLFDFYSELNKRRISLKQTAENHTFFQFLLDNLSVFYSRIPNDQEITILKFEEIIEDTLGDDLNEFHRMNIDEMVKGKEKAVEGFREKLGDYFQVGMKGGILLIKKKKKTIGKIENIPVENSNQEIFKEFQNTTTTFHQNLNSQIIPKSAMKKRQEKVEDNCDCLTRGTNRNLEYSEDIAKCVDIAREKVMKNYVHFENREMRLIERFFKEFTATLGNEKETLTARKDLDLEVGLLKETAEKLKITQDQLEESEKNCAKKDNIIQKLQDEISQLSTTNIIMKEQLLKVEANCSDLVSQNRILQKDNSMHLSAIKNFKTKLAEKQEVSTITRIQMYNQPMLNFHPSPYPQVYLFQPIILRQHGTSIYLNDFKKKYENARMICETVRKEFKLLPLVEYDTFMKSMREYENILVHNIFVCERNGSENELKNASLPIFSPDIQYILHNKMGANQQNNSICNF
ncbi:unnamed protein product [Caenorhabditis angaria]|uniref:Uncharacterized protein n=1 Tax=Caenorhabditis angaria TaxID=860376 RepID=A0A9P1I5Y4_9PELO|nr:unnamed protein product [Caenorhabditis angaria]